MSKLEYYARPLVAFDASNKEHRNWYFEFLQHNTWGKCPVRFICPNQSGMDLVKLIQEELVVYYVKKEFNKCDTSSPAGIRKASNASRTSQSTTKTTGKRKSSSKSSQVALRAANQIP